MTSWSNLIRYVIELNVEITLNNSKTPTKRQFRLCLCSFLAYSYLRKNLKIARLSLNANHSELLMLESF